MTICWLPFLFHKCWLWKNFTFTLWIKIFALVMKDIHLSNPQFIDKNLVESQIIAVTTTTTGEHKDLPTVGPLRLCARCSWHQGWRGGDQQVYRRTLYMYCIQCISLHDFCWSMYIPKYMHKVGEEVTNRFIDVHCTCIVHILYSVCLYMKRYMIFVDQCIFQSTCTRLARRWPTGLSMYILYIYYI